MSTDGVVFDLFHTLVDMDATKPAGFDRTAALATAAQLDLDDFELFWASTYLERETTTIDLVDLIARHVEAQGGRLSSERRRRLDDILGVGCDEGLRRPHDDIVSMVRAVAAAVPVGVLSNCHEREVRHWPDSPLAEHVSAIGRSSRIGAMKPDPATYRWITAGLDIEPSQTVYVGNGGSDELAGARRAGFGTVVHCNVFDRRYELVEPGEQQRRARDADVSVDTIDEFCTAMTRLVG